MKNVIFLVFLPLFFLNCATEPGAPKLIKPTNENIQKITINYQDHYEVEKYIESLRRAKPDYKSGDDVVLDYNSKEYKNTYVDIDISEEYWDLIINELKKPKKKLSIFASTERPSYYLRIRILYDNNKETRVSLSRFSFYTINNDSYHYDKTLGPNFTVLDEIIEKEKRNNRK